MCQYGRYFQALGVSPCQYVGVYMYNSPEFLFVWMGLLSIGAAPALVNYNLVSDALVHCLGLAGTRFLLYDDAPDCASRIEAADAQLRDIGVETIRLSDLLKSSIAENVPERATVDCFEKGLVLPLALMYTRYVCYLRGPRLPTRTTLLSRSRWKAERPASQRQSPSQWLETTPRRPCSQRPLASDRVPMVIGPTTASLCTMAPEGSPP